MKRAHLAVALLSLVSALASAPAFADTLYSNGSGIGTVTAENIGNLSKVTDSFTLTSTSTITGVEFVVWLPSVNDSIPSIDWQIGSTPFSGTASGAVPTSVFDETIEGGAEYIDTESFSIPSLVLGPGTYYLTLAYAETNLGNPSFWDINNGSSTAYWDSTSNPIESNDFEILGTSADVSDTPEPSSLLLMGTGLISLAGMIRRKVKA